MTEVKAGRPHAERLRKDLDEVRAQLIETVKDVAPEEMDWAPRPDLKMKTIKQLLQEIGAMEQVTCHMAIHQEELDWGGAWEALDQPDMRSLLIALTGIRTATLAYLDGCTEETLQTPIPLTPDWQGYFGAPEVEPEELIRWIVRHEYYHLGQLITYQWQRGCDPDAQS